MEGDQRQQVRQQDRATVNHSSVGSSVAESIRSGSNKDCEEAERPGSFDINIKELAYIK